MLDYNIPTISDVPKSDTLVPLQPTPREPFPDMPPDDILQHLSHQECRFLVRYLEHGKAKLAYRRCRVSRASPSPLQASRHAALLSFPRLLLPQRLPVQVPAGLLAAGLRLPLHRRKGRRGHGQDAGGPGGEATARAVPAPKHVQPAGVIREREVRRLAGGPPVRGQGGTGARGHGRLSCGGVNVL